MSVDGLSDEQQLRYSRHLLLDEWFGFTVGFMEGLNGIIFLQAIHYFPFILVNLSAALRNIDRSMEEAAQNLGSHGLRLFRRIALPLALPGYIAGASLVFVKVFDDVATPLLLNVKEMLAPQAYLRITSIGIDDPMGYVISVVLIVVAVATMWATALVMKGKDYATTQRGGGGLARRQLKPREQVLAESGATVVDDSTTEPGVRRVRNILDATVRARWAERLRKCGTEVIVADCLRPMLDALGLDEHRDAGHQRTLPEHRPAHLSGHEAQRPPQLGRVGQHQGGQRHPGRDAGGERRHPLEGGQQGQWSGCHRPAADGLPVEGTQPAPDQRPAGDHQHVRHRHRQHVGHHAAGTQQAGAERAREVARTPQLNRRVAPLTGADPDMQHPEKQGGHRDDHPQGAHVGIHVALSPVPGLGTGRQRLRHSANLLAAADSCRRHWVGSSP